MRVLVVEDEAPSARTIARGLGVGGFTVDVVHDGRDAAYDGDHNIVEVYVGYLRRKIDAPFGRRAIETLRGTGYRLAANGG